VRDSFGCRWQCRYDILCAFDTNKNGQLSRSELLNGLKGLGIVVGKADADELMQARRPSHRMHGVLQPLLSSCGQQESVRPSTVRYLQAAPPVVPPTLEIAPQIPSVASDGMR
jgi:hypothetical protein